MGTPIFIAGPTASGKTAVALEVARQRGGEIISVDSMQVYSGLDIGTAKPTAEERAAIPHHLIDILDLSETFDAAQFVHRVEPLVERIAKPILCGGTALYFKAWQEGLGEAPPADAALRQELENTEMPELLNELQRTDPGTYEIIDQQNPRRVIRAVEVIRLTGRPFSQQRAEWTGAMPPNFFLIERERDDLRRRMDDRVDAMFAAGLVEETCSLRSALEGNAVAAQALGYRQVIGHLNGEQDLPETVALVKSRTWQFARRQMTWFNKMQGAQILKVSAEETAAVTAQRVVAQMQPSA